mmetsp:Transcript_116475/g.276867  ORF Transcript_116475/g.276867 Transcript_116475/m.276867 type:complete len:284 (+) Transcript_116475:165-1016(+)
MNREGKRHQTGDGLAQRNHGEVERLDAGRNSRILNLEVLLLTRFAAEALLVTVAAELGTVGNLQTRKRQSVQQRSGSHSATHGGCQRHTSHEHGLAPASFFGMAVFIDNPAQCQRSPVGLPCEAACHEDEIDHEVNRSWKPAPQGPKQQRRSQAHRKYASTNLVLVHIRPPLAEKDRPDRQKHHSHRTLHDTCGRDVNRPHGSVEAAHKGEIVERTIHQQRVHGSVEEAIRTEKPETWQFQNLEVLPKEAAGQSLLVVGLPGLPEHRHCKKGDQANEEEGDTC